MTGLERTNQASRNSEQYLENQNKFSNFFFLLFNCNLLDRFESFKCFKCSNYENCLIVINNKKKLKFCFILRQLL